LITETLIIFSRYPEAGKTKTRMISALGADRAAKLQQEMTEHTLNTAKKLRSCRDIIVEVHFAGGNKQLMTEWLGQETQYIPQVAGDLGYKMYSAFERALSLNNQQVVIIGTDCPDLNQEILKEAFDSLYKQDLVLGAAQDGGYYLIGLNRIIPQLFENINWGTEQVLNQTKTIAQQLALKVSYLPCLSDVDRPEDLAVWQKYKSKNTYSRSKPGN
jgi:rSAM/selenodomain-associated transferase 1